jgi:peptidoglycan/LPS O-acetylase OafA/YrhL
MIHFGFAGVDLFFVLSGFVITWVHADLLGDRSRLAGYLGRRFWRIFPVFWVCWSLSAAAYIMGLGRPWPHDGWRLARQLFLIPSVEFNPFLAPAWTLTMEVMFYLTFAVLFLAPRRACLPILGLWFCAVVAAVAAGGPGVFDEYGKPGRFAAWFLYPNVVEFVLGCFAATAVRSGRVGWGRTCLAVGVAGFAAAGVATWAGYGNIINPHAGRVALFGLPSTLIVYGLVASERAHGWVLPRWLQVVGDASYAIYLVHHPVFQVLFATLFGRFGVTGPRHLHWVYWLAVPALGVGFLVHYAVERPLLRLAHRRRPVAPARATIIPISIPAFGGRRAA